MQFREPIRAASAAAVCYGLAAASEHLRFSVSPRPTSVAVLAVGIVAVALLTALVAAALQARLGSRAAAVFAATPAVAVSVSNVVPFLPPLELRTYAIVFVPTALGVWLVVRCLERPWILALATVAAVAAFVPDITHAIPHARPGATPEHPNIVLIVMDTTRRDHLSVYGYERPTTPGLAALARESQVFDDAWSVAPWTPSSHASMFTGLLPAEHGVDGDEPVSFPARPETLAELLRSAGYWTSGFVANPQLSGPGWDRGYDTYWSPVPLGRDALLGLLSIWENSRHSPAELRSARQIFDGLRREWTVHSGRPRFAFVNLLDAHRPYDPPPNYYDMFLSGVPRHTARAVDEDPARYIVHPGLIPHDAEILRGLYDGAIRSMDDEIHEFVEWLRARGELDRTILVITADHGEHLGERGLVGHDLHMDPFLLRVPLLARYPPRLPAERVTRRVQLDGLPGWLLDLAGVAAPPRMAEKSLASQDRDIVVAQYERPRWYRSRLVRAAMGTSFDVNKLIVDTAFVADRRFACLCEVSGPSGACQFVDWAQDPAWTADVAADHPSEAAALEQIARNLPRFSGPSSAGRDPALDESLRALGYVN
jgi:arylsulfatase A-like enzyme